MGMSIDINGSIKELSKWRKNLNYDNGDYCYGDDITRRSLDVAIETMRKYQKIEEIYSDWNDGRFSDAVFCLRVKAVLNGNDD